MFVTLGMLSCCAGHLDSQSSIRYVLLATSLISLAFTITQGVLEIVSPDEIFHVNSKDYYLFGHGGMLFWFVSSVVFTMVRRTNSTSLLCYFAVNCVIPPFSCLMLFFCCL
jgi:hypothetical protein